MRVVRRVLSGGTTAALLVLVVLCWPTYLGGSTTIVVVAGRSMEPTWHAGDVVVVRQGTYEVGDPIVYSIPEGDPGAGRRVIHRIVGGDGVDGWTTQGDNRDEADPWHPTDEDVVGRAVTTIPWVGRLRVLLTGWQGLSLVLSLAVTAALWPDDDESHDDRDDPDRVPAGSSPGPGGRNLGVAPDGAAPAPAVHRHPVPGVGAGPGRVADAEATA